MFENCSVLLLKEEKRKIDIVKVDIDSATQKDVCAKFSAAFNQMCNGKVKIPFNHNYIITQDDEEYFSIGKFQLPISIKEALKNPMGVDSVDLKLISNIEQENVKIKAAIIGRYNEDEDTFFIAFQKFKRDQYLTRMGNFNLFFNNNIFRKEESFGIRISDEITCIFDADELKFISYHLANQILSLSEYYIEATDVEVESFISSKSLDFDEIPNFKSNMADQTIRKKIASITSSKILDDYNVNQIKNMADSVNFGLNIKNNKIVFPNEKSKVKDILRFLDEEVYQGVFSRETFVTNSKRKIQ